MNSYDVSKRNVLIRNMNFIKVFHALQEQNKALRLKDDIFTSIQEDVASESLDRNEIDDESPNKSQK